MGMNSYKRFILPRPYNNAPKNHETMIKLGSIYLLLILSLSLSISPPMCSADQVILKTGEKFNTRQRREKDGTIQLFSNGSLISVEKKTVEKIIEDNNADKKDMNNHTAQKKGQRTPFGASGYGNTGLGNFTWGMHPTKIKGLEKIGTDPAYGGVDQYIKTDDITRYGRANLTRIVYEFWKNRLYTITIRADGFTAYKKLKKEAFRLFGNGEMIHGDTEKFIWHTGMTHRLLQYNFNTDTSLLWFRSRDLDTEVKRLYPN